MKLLLKPETSTPCTRCGALLIKRNGTWIDRFGWTICAALGPTHEVAS